MDWPVAPTVLLAWSIVLVAVKADPAAARVPATATAPRSFFVWLVRMGCASQVGSPADPGGPRGFASPARTGFAVSLAAGISRRRGPDWSRLDHFGKEGTGRMDIGFMSNWPCGPIPLVRLGHV